MREYLTLHTSVFPSYLTIESGRMFDTCNQLAHSQISSSVPDFAVKTSPVFAALVKQACMHIYN